MTRLEENEKVIETMLAEVESQPAKTYERVVTFQLGAIVSMLADISKSLAVIADKAESENKK